MDKIISEQLHIISNQRTRKYVFTQIGIVKFGRLKPKSQDLLIDMLLRVRYNEPCIELTYEDVGYTDSKYFSRIRKEILDSELLFMDGDTYFVNPIYIDCLSKNLKEELYRKYGITKVKVPKFRRHM